MTARRSAATKGPSPSHSGVTTLMARETSSASRLIRAWRDAGGVTYSGLSWSFVDGKLPLDDEEVLADVLDESAGLADLDGQDVRAGLCLDVDPEEGEDAPLPGRCPRRPGWPQLGGPAEERHRGRPDRAVGFEINEDGLPGLEGPVSEPDDRARRSRRRLSAGPGKRRGRRARRQARRSSGAGVAGLHATAPRGFFLSTFPGSRPVCVPSSTTTWPLTMTFSIPSG